MKNINEVLRDKMGEVEGRIVLTPSDFKECFPEPIGLCHAMHWFADNREWLVDTINDTSCCTVISCNTQCITAYDLEMYPELQKGELKF